MLHCDGDWEHAYGFKIENVDNPGWMITFDLADTKLSLCAFDEVNEQRSELDWVICKKKDAQFVGYGGPQNLQELLSRFRAWAEAHHMPGQSVWIEQGSRS